MDPIPLRDIVISIKDHFEKTGSGCPQAERMVEQAMKFDRKEVKSKLQLVTFHDTSGRVIFETYVPIGVSDQEAIARAQKLIPAVNPLREKLASCSVKWR